MQSEILEKSLVQQISEDARGGSVSDSGTSFYHGRTPPTSASAIEQLQSLLKQKEGELANAQVSKDSKNIGVGPWMIVSHDYHMITDSGELPREITSCHGQRPCCCVGTECGPHRESRDNSSSENSASGHYTIAQT